MHGPEERKFSGMDEPLNKFVFHILDFLLIIKANTATNDRIEASSKIKITECAKPYYDNTDNAVFIC